MNKRVLGSTARGPIAETYHDLQRLEQIEAALATGEGTADIHHQLAHAYLQSLELVFLNLTNLVEQSRRSLEEGKDQALVGRWRWHEAVSHLGVRILYRLMALADDARLGGDRTLLQAGSRAANDYVARKVTFDALVQDKYWKPRRAEALEEAHFFGVNYDQVALFIQTTKNTNHDVIRLLSTPFLSRDLGAYDQLIGGKFLRKAVALDDYDMEGTFFLQFLLLHQVPEIVGDRVVEAFQQAAKCLSGQDLRGCLDRLALAVTALDLVIECLTPLRQLMIPADYFKIRENLGLTSGSHSDTIHTHMLNTAFKELKATSEIFSRMRAGRPGTLTLSRLLRRISVQLLQWRTEHLVFPRNLLGGDGTRSLVGAADGLKAAESMLGTYAATMGIQAADADGLGKPSKSEQLLAQIVSADAYLLSLTAQFTKQGFPKVQERLPPFDGRPKKGRGRRSERMRGTNGG